jgi:hypothetical protein
MLSWRRDAGSRRHMTPIETDYREDQERFRRQELARRQAERAAADLDDDEAAEVMPVDDEDQGGHA